MHPLSHWWRGGHPSLSWVTVVSLITSENFERARRDRVKLTNINTTAFANSITLVSTPMSLPRPLPWIHVRMLLFKDWNDWHQQPWTLFGDRHRMSPTRRTTPTSRTLALQMLAFRLLNRWPVFPWDVPSSSEISLNLLLRINRPHPLLPNS